MKPSPTAAATPVGRRRFLEVFGLSFLTGISVIIARCGSTSSDSGGGAAAATPSHTGDVANNHGHAVSVTGTQLDADTALTLDMRGTADHTHSISLTSDQLTSVKGDTEVQVTSTPGGTDNHTHVVTFNDSTNTPVTPTPSPSAGW